MEDMLARLEEQHFLAVVGSGGCGKSSLVRAGLLPALEQGFLSDAEPNWRMAVMRPRNAPFTNLTAALMEQSALGREQGHGANAGAFLQATLRRGALGLLEAVVESHLPQEKNEGTNLLLVVDQFEEIFRYRKQSASGNDADLSWPYCWLRHKPGNPVYPSMSLSPCAPISSATALGSTAYRSPSMTVSFSPLD